MSVTTEQATVYRGGGRRWFSQKAAIKAEASAIFRKHVSKLGKCDCDRSDRHFDPIADMAPYVCHYHDYDGDFRKRFIARITRRITNSLRSQA